MANAPETPRLFLLDSMALIYRAHFALIRSPRYTSGGVATSAVFGVANTVLDILERERPTHMAAAFDSPEPTHRHEEFEEYKAKRDAQPEDIEIQIPLVRRLFDAFRIPSIEIAGLEADDIIGTLARRAAEEEMTVFMVTPDKDFHQLVTDRIFVYRPGRQGGTHEILGVPEVLDRWQIERVDQVIDILGLMGDASDNVPGIKGIGEKTAQKLIATYGSVESLLDHVADLKGKQRERIEEGRDSAILSKRLVTIVQDADFAMDPADLAVASFDRQALQGLFTELEFDSLGKRIFGPSFTAASARSKVIRERREAEIQTELFSESPSERTIRDVRHDYRIVRTKEERAALIERLRGAREVAFDTETTGLDPRSAAPLGMSFSCAPNDADYVVLPEDEAEVRGVIEEFRSFFEDESIEKIGHNLKYDLTVLRWRGIRVRGRLFDTMLAHSMKEPEMRHGLDYLAKLYLGYRPIPTSDLIGERGKEERNMKDVPLDVLAEYACEDADVTLQVSRVIRPDLEKHGVDRVCFDVEFPLVPVLVDMEYEGIRLDVQAIEEYSKQLAIEIEELRQRIWAAAGHEFNIDSPKQLGEVIYGELALDPSPKKTATGQYTTREAELVRLLGRHPIVGDILEYRSATKLKSVYVDQLPAAVDPRTGRVHTHYSQAWTATGRMQSNDPNLQTIPVRKERGREIRAAFRARGDDWLILAADYSQIELRIMADLSGDRSLREAFERGQDIHAATAAKLYGVHVDEVSREMRDRAKAVNFGIIYGISAYGLQQRLDIRREEADALIDGYFEQYPGVREYIDRTIESARELGYVRTKLGRRRYIRDISSRNRSLRSAAERLAMNSPIQGTAADMLKLAMIEVDAGLARGGFRTRMLLTVHDEIVFDLHREERGEVLPVVENAMKTALPLAVPIEVELGVGENWLEAH